MLMIGRLCLRICIQQRPNVGTECEVPSNVGNFLQRFPYPVRTFLRAQLAHVFTALPNSFPSDCLRSLVMEKIRYKPQGRKCKLFLQEFGPPASRRCKLNFLFKYYINVNISSKTEIRENSLGNSSCSPFQMFYFCILKKITLTDAVQSQCFIAPLCKRVLKYCAVSQKRKKHFMSPSLSNKLQHSSVRRLYHLKTTVCNSLFNKVR